MLARAATLEFFEFWPLISHLVAALPALLAVVEDRFARVERACGFCVVGLREHLVATWAFSLFSGVNHFEKFLNQIYEEI